MSEKPDKAAKSTPEVPTDEESTMFPKEQRRQADADASVAEMEKRDRDDERQLAKDQRARS